MITVQTAIDQHGPVEAVQHVLAEYFDAIYEADPARIAAIFHSEAVYATADETPLLHRNLPTYLAVMEARESPQSRGEARKDIIDSIEFAGENTARAQVRCSIGKTDHVDFLTLVRDEGRWQIIAKVFQIIPGS
ncbi:MAG: nuclear transport factor 2 family protein [Pseudomonadota bacterium]